MDIYVTTTKCQAFYEGHFTLASPLGWKVSLSSLPILKISNVVSEIKQIQVLSFK